MLKDLNELISSLPVPPDLRSEHMLRLLRKAIVDPASLAPRDVKEMAVAAAFEAVSRPH